VRKIVISRCDLAHETMFRASPEREKRGSSNKLQEFSFSRLQPDPSMAKSCNTKQICWLKLA
jgi:hypothetical protein